MLKQRRIITVALVLLLSCILGLTSLYTPKVKGSNESGFSAENAAKDIKVIATNPHTINDQEELGKVREYLLGRLKELGVEPTVFNYEAVTDKYDWTYETNNIYGKIDGKNGEDGTYILLVAHYDSSPKKRAGEEGGSKGAADDGYGLSTILEVLRLIQESGKPLENGIKILFTDAEETGLYGANNEMVNNFNLYENVSFVINLEARGIKGPAIMFETNDNNLEVVKFFKNAKLPVSYSLAADVYRKMPNGSDFTEFINKGMKGINIAVLDSLDYYHTPLDNYDNINLSSLQHYGEQVLPMVQEFVYSEKYGEKSIFDASENAIFFTILPNTMFLYSSKTGMILTVVALILLLVISMMLSKRSRITLKKSIVWSLNWLLIGAGMLAVGLGISKILSKIYDIPFKITYMPKIPYANTITLITVIIGLAIAALLVSRALKRGTNEENILLGGQIVNFILLVVFMLVLPGGSFLFLWPILLSCLSVIITIWLNNKKIKGLVMLIPAVVATMIYVPILYVLNIALTIGALCVVMLLTVVAAAVIIPSIYCYLNIDYILISEEKSKITFKRNSNLSSSYI